MQWGRGMERFWDICFLQWRERSCFRWAWGPPGCLPGVLRQVLVEPSTQQLVGVGEASSWTGICWAAVAEDKGKREDELL